MYIFFSFYAREVLRLREPILTICNVWMYNGLDVIEVHM